MNWIDDVTFALNEDAFSILNKRIYSVKAAIICDRNVAETRSPLKIFEMHL